MEAPERNEFIINSDYFWPGSYTDLIMEQIRNSQEEQMIQASYQVQTYTCMQFQITLIKDNNYTRTDTIKINLDYCKKY